MSRDRTIICACSLTLGVLWWLIAAPVLSSAGYSHRIFTPGLLSGLDSDRRGMCRRTAQGEEALSIRRMMPNNAVQATATVPLRDMSIWHITSRLQSRARLPVAVPDLQR